jgi:hypothetical protein
LQKKLVLDQNTIIPFELSDICFSAARERPRHLKAYKRAIKKQHVPKTPTVTPIAISGTSPPTIPLFLEVVEDATAGALVGTPSNPVSTENGDGVGEYKVEGNEGV